MMEGGLLACPMLLVLLPPPPMVVPHRQPILAARQPGLPLTRWSLGCCRTTPALAGRHSTAAAAKVAADSDRLRSGPARASVAWAVGESGERGAGEPRLSHHRGSQ